MESDSDINSDINLEDDENDDDTLSESSKRAPLHDKRAYHNLLERRRRRQIKESFCALRDSIPSLRGEVGKAKASRAQILKSASSYIVSLTENRSKTQKEIDELQEESLQLEKQIKALEMSESTSSLAVASTSSVDCKRKLNGASNSGNIRSGGSSSNVCRRSGIGSSRLNSARTGNSSIHLRNRKTINSTLDVNTTSNVNSLSNTTCQTDNSLSDTTCQTDQTDNSVKIFTGLNIKTEDLEEFDFYVKTEDPEEFVFYENLSNNVMLGTISPTDHKNMSGQYNTSSESLNVVDSAKVNPSSSSSSSGVGTQLSTKNVHSTNGSDGCYTSSNSLDVVDSTNLNQKSIYDCVNLRTVNNSTLSSLNDLNSVDFSPNNMEFVFIRKGNDNTSLRSLNELNSADLDDPVADLFDLIPIKEESMDLTDFDFSCFEDDNLLSPKSKRFRK